MLNFLGQCSENFVTCVKYFFSGKSRIPAIINQAAAISYDSLGISMVIVFIAAAVIALQISKQFLMSGAESYVGGFLAIALVREIAPGFAALAISARAGTAISAEMANMKVTSQVDAIKVLQIDPVGYFFTPRIIAGAFTVPCVVILAILIGIIGGMIVSYYTIDLHPNRYFNSVWLMLRTKDLYIAIFKGMIFGALISLVCSTQGYNTEGGAREVGASTTKAAILSTIYLLFADLIINMFFYIG